MTLKNWSTILIAVVLATIAILGFRPKGDPPMYVEQVRAALRDVGHQMLLYDGDATSLVRPVKQSGRNSFEIAFQNQLTINPDTLVHIVNSAMIGSKLPKEYIVEVNNCQTKEVVYSYHMKNNKENNVIPCLGRKLPLGCYTISVIFIKKQSSFVSANIHYIAPLIFILALVTGLVFLPKNRTGPVDNGTGPVDERTNSISLGKYIFYYEQNKLKNERLEIDLTSKESELLKIFSQHPNQIINRDRLLREVWEDKGVFVGRSLDVFVSKLRKKLENDASIQIVSVHGIGYKMNVFSTS